MKRAPPKPKPDRLLLLTDRLDRLADQLRTENHKMVLHLASGRRSSIAAFLRHHW